jgi:hypothetical protein
MKNRQHPEGTGKGTRQLPDPMPLAWKALMPRQGGGRRPPTIWRIAESKTAFDNWGYILYTHLEKPDIKPGMTEQNRPSPPSGENTAAIDPVVLRSKCALCGG